jgi:hypothetical protein
MMPSDCVTFAGRIGPRDLQMPSLIVALHRDAAQATALRCALDRMVDADVVMADTIGELLDVIDARTPNLILVDPFMPPHEADHLTGYLALLPEANHVQTISAPVIAPFTGLDTSLKADASQSWLRRTFLPNRRPQATPPVVRWNAEAFAAEVAAYLSLSLNIKADNEERQDTRDVVRTIERRQASRCSAKQASLEQPLFVAADRADLVNVSSTGLLVQTGTRPSPYLPRLRDGYPQDQSALTLFSASGDAIRRTGVPVRCRPMSLGDGRFLYEVAFRLDAPLDLPSGLVDECAALVGKYGPRRDWAVQK